ncbi:MAG: hypothetical protein KJ674_05460 [Nanoarchaeota archaeon]|nr:hypothetical protein [Nanoarchaeota archaeon]
MKKIKLGFKYFWPGFNPEDNFFTNFLRRHYEVIISKNPDYLIYSVFGGGGGFEKHAEQSGKIKKYLPNLHSRLKKSFLWTAIKHSNYWKKRLNTYMPEVKGNFVRIFYAAENMIPDMSKCDWALSYCYEEEFNHPKHFRIPFYLVMEFGENLIKKKINFEEIKKEKTKFCNFIYSNDVEFRNRFFKKLNKYQKVDSPGRCMNNMPPIGNYKEPGQSRNAFTWLEEKTNFLKKYKFTIAIENFLNSPGYVTEKITHPMIVNSIPIYWGNPLISRDFNPKSFINIEDFKNFKGVIKKIEEIDQNDDLYEKMLRKPWFKNNKPNKYVDEKKLLKKFKEIFG